MTGLDGKRVIKIQCGFECSAILTDDGVYAMGTDLCGGETRSMPTKIELPDEIDDISIGEAHILAKTTTGQVFAWGSNSEDCAGACGVGTNSDVEKPIRVQLPDNVVVVDISAGKKYSIIKCTKLH